MKIEGVGFGLARQSSAKTSDPTVQTETKTRQTDRADVLSLSQEARKAALEQIENLRQQLIEANRQADETSDGFEVMRNCMLIALRIMNGDKVPFKDQQYLQKHQPEMYAQALLMRRKNDDPKDHKSVLRCRDKQSCNCEQASAVTGDAREILTIAAEGVETKPNQE